MSLLSRQELKRALKQRRVDPLYLLFGLEDYLRDSAARVITDAALKGAPLREFNEASYSLAKMDVRQAVAGAEQLPMMASRRVVRIADFSKLNESDDEVLVKYISRPAESSVVIFVAEDLDKRRKLTRKLLEACTSVEFPKLNHSELNAWAKSRLRELKVDVDPRTLNHILSLVGNDIRRLSSELEKLATASLGSGQITIEMVDSLTGRSRELSNFELTDHLIARDRRKSLQTVRRLLDDGVEPLMLLGLIASSYHRLALAKELMARQEDRDQVFKMVGMPFNKRKEFLEIARRSDRDTLARSLERIAAADFGIKNSKATPRMQLEMLVCELSGAP